MRRSVAGVLAILVTLVSSIDLLHAWGDRASARRLIAAGRLTPVARQNVAWLLDGQTLADVSELGGPRSAGADLHGLWHYVDLPVDPSMRPATIAIATDSPGRPPIIADPAEVMLALYRDCIVDRITFWEETAGQSETRSRRRCATALKFVMISSGDVHLLSRFTGIDLPVRQRHPVRVFGQVDCGTIPVGSCRRNVQF